MAALALIACLTPAAFALDKPLQVTRFRSQTEVEVLDRGKSQSLHRYEHSGAWTLMEIASGTPGYAVFEDFTRRDGHVLFVFADGTRLELSKTLESSRPDADAAAPYLGHSIAELEASTSDLLAQAILAHPGDPQYAQVARALPPIRNVRADTFSFVGTPNTHDKIGFTYGGRTPNFDPAVYQHSIETVRKRGDVWHGLVGGSLPVLRFVYPEASGAWTELLAFAPLRIDNDNDRVQPVWYRVSRVERGALQWSRHIDSYQPFPPWKPDTPARFYADLLQLERGWRELLRGAMTVELPEARVADMARFGLVRALMTRIGTFPKYGVFDRDYGASEHDGFPDTFTVETTALLDWGLLAHASRTIANYLTKFVRDDGSMLYRGPEVGQLGRMLTVIARYVDVGGDPELLLRTRSRIDGITRVLLELRARAMKLPKSDPAYGMIAGWSEADSCLEPDPARYMQPYFSNSTEAARGLRDLGRVWLRLGKQAGVAALTAWGERLIREAETLRQDVDTAIARSWLDVAGARVLPAIAGAKQPFDVASRRDPLDPQVRAYRAYNELMYSGSLTPDQVRSIVTYRADHRDVIVGLPTAYNKRELAGFLAYGYGYGLIQSDMIREALLLLYADMAHQYTRGSWLAPETRQVFAADEAQPYCVPAQLVATLMTRWLLVFEDPQSDTLWLGKAIPRRWLEDGAVTKVSDAPTRWGHVSAAIISHAASGTIHAHLDFPSAGLPAEIKLRLRAPEGLHLRAVTRDGQVWTKFDTAAEVITLPAGTAGAVELVAHY